jgi:hypothetical protein
MMPPSPSLSARMTKQTYVADWAHGRRAVLRRRNDHSGNFGAERGRGARSRDASPTSTSLLSQAYSARISTGLFGNRSGTTPLVKAETIFGGVARRA